MRCLLLLLLVGRGLCGVVRMRVRVRPMLTGPGRSERGGAVAQGAWRMRSGLSVELSNKLVSRAVERVSRRDRDVDEDGREERTGRKRAAEKRAARRCSGL